VVWLAIGFVIYFAYGRNTACCSASCGRTPRVASLRGMRRRAALLLALGTAALPLQVASQPTEAVVVYLVRHAERAEDGTDDPRISVDGEARARLLAEMLRDARITHVHTTDTRRTRATAAPTAAAVGVAPTLYDADDLDALAALIRRTPGRHLVVGHSNTLRETVGALGGEPGEVIDQDEYDRLYVLTLTEGGTTTAPLRFGSAYRAAPR
jgi:probable phosphoglycerate mutase